MAKRHFLEDLVKSLTKGELKKFSFYTKNISSQKSYLDIFNEIRKNKTVKHQKYDNKYAQQRRYLYNIILESMIHRDHEESAEGKVFFYIKSANYLLRKQLPEQAYDIINKALNIVRKHEMFGYHLAILELEKEVRLFTNPSKYRPDSEILEEEKKLIDYQKELQTLKLIFNHIRSQKKKFGIIGSQAWLKIKDEILEMGLFPEEHFYKTNKAKFYFYYSWVLLYMFGQGYKIAYEFAKKMMALPKDGLSKSEKLNAILQYSSCAMEMGNTQEILKVLSEVKKDFDYGEYSFYERTELQIFYYRSNYELTSYVFEGQKDKVIKKIEEIEKGIKHWDKKIPLEIKMVLAAALKLGYYAVGDIKNAKKQVLFLIQNQNSGLRVDAYEDGLIYHMFFIFEKNDMSYLENESRKIFYYFKYHYPDIKDPDVIMKKQISHLFLEYAMYKIDQNELLESLKKTTLDRYEADKNDFLEIEYPYLIWVNSKLQQKSFLETAAAMAKTHLNKT